ncbi:reverse transcriptase domain-containing protein [Tanacetum coccineum]
MTGVPRHIAKHRLNVREGCPPVRQKKRSQAPERNKTIQEEVERLVEADIMKEFHYHSWLSNPIGRWNPSADTPSRDILLKNARATYQRLVDKAFQKQIGRNLKVYVDDLAIKSRTEQEIIRDIEETLKTLRKINMKLNIKKCTFGVEEGMFLGYMVNTKGIQKCTKKSDFQWTAKAETAFKQMKRLIAELPTLTTPMEKEELIVYLAAAKEAVSAVLMTEREEKQMPIYFVSRALQGPEINYTPMEKLVLALVYGSKRLKRPRVSIKGKILADFIVEPPEDDSLAEPMEVEEELLKPWTLFTDGSSCIDGSGAGLILTNSEGTEFTYALRFEFNATNNEAEYDALISGLRIAEQMGINNLQTNVDSRLVANQVNESYIAKEPGKIQYLEKVKALTNSFKKFSIKQVPKSENKKADALNKIASTSFAYLTKQMTPIYEYLTEEILPAEKKKARAVRLKSRRFGLPREISDNGKQFRDNPFKDWCEKLNIRQRFASVKHPQANDLVERANRSLGEGVKARLDKGSKDWIEEIPHVVWAHRTMIKSSNGETPFSLTYRTEAVIPAEIGMPTLRTTKIDMVQNNEALKLNLDLFEEKREQAAIREARSKAKMEKYYNSKLGPKWEGPYEMIEALSKGGTKIKDRICKAPSANMERP